MAWIGWWFVASLSPVLRTAWGHGDAHLQIVELDRQILTNSRNPALFLRRGELHRLDGNWTNALADLDRATALDPKLDAVLLERGRIYFDAGQPEKATNFLSQYLRLHPTNAIARLTRARAFLWMTQPSKAIEDYHAAIQFSPAAGPDLFLERASAQRSLGESGLEQALAGILEGIQSHGAIVSLEMAALELEVDLKRWDAAIQRLDRMAISAPRRDRWLMRRAEILELAGRASDAQQSWKDARREFQSLPERMRMSKAGQQMDAKLTEKLGPLPK